MVLTVGPNDHGKWFQGGPGKWIEIVDQTVVLGGKPGDLDVIMDTPGRVADLLRNYTFKNCRIIYTGRAFELVDVFFDNCTFDLPDTDQGRVLAKTIIEKDFPSFVARG